MENKKLTGKEYWEGISLRNSKIFNLFSNLSLFQSYYHFVFKNILGWFIKPSYRSVIEIGCAPGNYLIKFHKFFGLNPFGVEYAENGYKETIQNFEINKLPKENIILADFFNETFQKENYERYDIVFSAGFIEHFTDPSAVLSKQASLVKKGGLLICLIPNVKYVNEWLSSKEVVALHNQSIMDDFSFKSLVQSVPQANILYCGYFGGIFNIGLLNTKNRLLRLLLFFLFLVQRFTLDILQKLFFFFFHKDLTSRYSSPSLLCILEKR